VSPTPWADIASATDNRLFARFGEAVSVGLRSAGAYNPTTGTTSADVYTPHAATAIIDDRSGLALTQPSGGEARQQMFGLLIRTAGLPRAIAIGDRIAWRGLSIQVVEIQEEGYGGALYAQRVVGRSV
jgi:hypothetical protein